MGAVRVGITLVVACLASTALAAPAPSVVLRVARATAENRARFGAGDDPVPARELWPVHAKRGAAALALGAEAFALFPAGVDATWELRISDADALRALGVTLDEHGEAIGLLFVERAGIWRAGYSCALCHTRQEANGSVHVGPANAALRYGDLLAGAYPDHPRAAAWRGWGRGRVDVTPDDEDDPLRIPDLVGLDSATYLQQSGAVRVASAGALAQRIAAVLARSPVAAEAGPAAAGALAAWLRALPQPTPPDAARRAGATIFQSACARCHDGPALGGRRLVDADVVGTDGAAARSSTRGTGAYRVPPLLGVGSRARFFHDGAISRLADVLDPRRFSPAFSGGALGPGAVTGHPFGTTLDGAARDALLGFLGSSRW